MADQRTPIQTLRNMGPKPTQAPDEGNEWFWDGTKWDQRPALAEFLPGDESTYGAPPY